MEKSSERTQNGLVAARVSLILFVIGAFFLSGRKHLTHEQYTRERIIKIWKDKSHSPSLLSPAFFVCAKLETSA